MQFFDDLISRKIAPWTITGIVKANPDDENSVLISTKFSKAYRLPERLSSCQWKVIPKSIINSVHPAGGLGYCKDPDDQVVTSLILSIVFNQPTDAASAALVDLLIDQLLQLQATLEGPCECTGESDAPTRIDVVNFSDRSYWVSVSKSRGYGGTDLYEIKPSKRESWRRYPASEVTLRLFDYPGDERPQEYTYTTGFSTGDNYFHISGGELRKGPILPG
jgi:hypothetical protein